MTAHNGLKELSNYIITSKYAKYLPKQKRRETWSEIVDRSLNMHLKKFNNLPEEDKEEIKWAFDLVREKKVLPSMRGMQYAGDAIERKNERQYNCCAMHVYNSRCVEKAFYLLLCGCGVGFGLGKKWVNQFPNLVKEKTKDVFHIVSDDIEGWARSVKILLDSYLEGNEISGARVHFDYSLIRSKGSPLSHGGTAPGSLGLLHAHIEIEKLLQSLESNKLRTIDVYDILMHVSDAVLSGGLRRAACIALFDKDDELMMNAKTGNWFEQNPQRARSNNTVLLKRDTTTLADFQYIIERTRMWGEPGFAFVNDEDTIFNPCLEVAFLPFWNGEPAVQMCNLSTINGEKVETRENLRTYTKAATIIGTLQAAYTDFKFLDEGDRKVTEEEALLGVTITGFMADPDILLNEDILADSSKYAVEVNEEWAKKIGINPAARVTVVKPAGTSSCALESPFSGIHPAHHRKYFRRVQANKDEVVYQHFKSINPHLCEESVYSATNTDDIILFPISLEGSKGIIKDDLTALEHLDIVKKVHKSWIQNGEKNNTKPISHSVSCTIVVDEHEWEDVAQYLYNNKDYFTAASLLAKTGDKDYLQAPFEAVRTPEDYHIWNSLNYQTKEVDYTTMIEETDTTKRNEEASCVGGYCEI